MQDDAGGLGWGKALRSSSCCESLGSYHWCHWDGWQESLSSFIWCGGTGPLMSCWGHLEGFEWQLRWCHWELHEKGESLVGKKSEGVCTWQLEDGESKRTRTRSVVKTEIFHLKILRFDAEWQLFTQTSWPSLLMGILFRIWCVYYKSIDRHYKYIYIYFNSSMSAAMLRINWDNIRGGACGNERGCEGSHEIWCRWSAPCEVKRKGWDRLARRHDPLCLPAV